MQGKRTLAAAIKEINFEHLDLAARGLLLPQPGPGLVGGRKATHPAVVTAARAPVRLRVMPLFTMVDRRKRLHLDLLERPREHYAEGVEQMGIHRQPLPAYAPSSAAARAYRALWDELKRKL